MVEPPLLYRYFMMLHEGEPEGGQSVSPQYLHSDCRKGITEKGFAQCVRQSLFQWGREIV